MNFAVQKLTVRLAVPPIDVEVSYYFNDGTGRKVRFIELLDAKIRSKAQQISQNSLF